LLRSQRLRAPAGSRLVRTDFDGDTLTLGIATTNPGASGPTCGHETWLDLRGACIARHARGHEPHALVRIPAHFEGLFRRQAPTPAPAEAPADPVARPLSIDAELVEGGRPWAR
jgi:hypothetical protein